VYYTDLFRAKIMIILVTFLAVVF